MITKPRYTHDCNSCKFLGHFLHWDMYQCTNATYGEIYIARYGNEGQDYDSHTFSYKPMLETIRNSVPCLMCEQPEEKENFSNLYVATQLMFPFLITKLITWK